MKRYFSLSEKALTIGVPLAEVLPAIYEEDRTRVTEALSEAIEQSGVYQIEYRVNHSDGNMQWLSARGTVERDEDGKAVELAGFAVDITRIKDAEEERERLLRSEQAAREEAERANRLKDEFLATLSHELRTPLNAILGWSQMLQNGNLDEAEFKRATGTIERNARAQSQLIDDILDVSRIIRGKLRLDVRAVDLSNVISAAVDAARPAAEAKNIRLQTLIDPQATQISGDPDRLQQVVWNLLSNAIKFTPKDGRVQVRLERVNSHVEIVVSDTGAGIEPEFLPFVFERFRQSDGSMTRRHGGLGLGLAIVRQLVELHGGTVSVTSAGEGQGAAFIVSLPLLPVRREPESDVPRVHPTELKTACSHFGPDFSCILLNRSNLRN
jgi:signal transduction histidine kinase